LVGGPVGCWGGARSHGDVNGKDINRVVGRGAGECCLGDLEADVGGALVGVAGDEASGFKGDGVLGVDETGEGGQVGAEGVEGVADVIGEDLLAVAALEEVVAKGV
jgi:hypothetical protein